MLLKEQDSNLSHTVSSAFLGSQDFNEVCDLQKQLVHQIKGHSEVRVLGLELKPVITLGIRGNTQTDVIFSNEELSIPVVTTDRGGHATVHSPGQLIIYPMIDLKFFKMGIKSFIDNLFAVTKVLLKRYGVETEYDSEKPGLYTINGKIAFVGIKVDQGVTRHGIAINVSNNLELFNGIKSCGIRCQRHDKLT